MTWQVEDSWEDWPEVVLQGGPETTLCEPPSEMPEARPVIGFRPYTPRHRSTP